MKALRELYQKVTGKRAFNGWDEKELETRMAAHVPKELPKDHKEEEKKHKEDVKERRTFTPYSANELLNKLFHVLRDGRYRRMLRDLMETQPNKKQTIKGLTILQRHVQEGELKAHIQTQIDILNN